LISRASEAEQAEPLGIRYQHADVTAQGAVGEGGFDAATCNFGLSDIDDLDAALIVVSGALHPGGSFVFSILHPCFAGGKDISGSWPAAGSYYDEGHRTASGVTACGSTSSPNRSRSQIGTPFMMRTASPCSSSPGQSSLPQPDCPHRRNHVASSSPGRCLPIQCAT
jgi:hypothetical protein